MSHEIIDELLTSVLEPDYSPTDHQFQLVDLLIKDYSVDDICEVIFNRYKPNVHNRHLVAMVYSMLIWYSSDHDFAVSRFMNNWVYSDDTVKVGVAISRSLEWFPFSTELETLDGVKMILKEFPQFKEDCEYWSSAAKKQL